MIQNDIENEPDLKEQPWINPNLWQLTQQKVLSRRNFRVRFAVPEDLPALEMLEDKLLKVERLAV